MHSRPSLREVPARTPGFPAGVPGPGPAERGVVVRAAAVLVRRAHLGEPRGAGRAGLGAVAVAGAAGGGRGAGAVALARLAVLKSRERRVLLQDKSKVLIQYRDDNLRSYVMY